MEWYNAKLLPSGLPELAYQVTPVEIADRLRVVALARRPAYTRGALARVMGDDPRKGEIVMEMYSHAIFADTAMRWSLDVAATAVWLHFLTTYLHELGHVVALLDGRDPADAARYRSECGYRWWVEELADAWADEMLARIAARDPYLGQPVPGRLEGYPGRLLFVHSSMALREGRMRGWTRGSAYNTALASARAALVGGQFTVSDVARKLRVHRYTVLRWARRLGLGKTYVDGAGRRHLFFAWHEVLTLKEVLA